MNQKELEEGLLFRAYKDFHRKCMLGAGVTGGFTPFSLLTKKEEIMDAKDLFEFVESVAGLKADGHFTLMKFTTGWKAMFFTPNMDVKSKSREQIFMMPSFSTAERAIQFAINDHLGTITTFIKGK